MSTVVEATDGLDDVGSGLALPDDRSISTVLQVAEGLPAPGLRHVVGAEGTAGPLLARQIARRTSAPVVTVTSDIESAQRAHADLGFVDADLHEVGKRADAVAPLLLLPSESGPYAHVHPDRRAAANRAATLFHVAAGLPWRHLVVPAPALVRRIVPLAALRRGGRRIDLESEIDVRDVARRLADSGYLRVPVVEDPGGFAIRGGLIDVWPPSSTEPVRIELLGDLVASIRVFDPDSQRTADALPSIWVPPAREVPMDDDLSARARDTVRSLCDAVNLPSTKARQLVEDVASGRAFFGADGFLPAFYELEPLLDALPEEASVVIEDPAAVVKALRTELEQAATGAAERSGTPHFPLELLFCDEAAVAESLGARRVLSVHRWGVAGKGDDPMGPLDELESPPEDAPTLGSRDHSELTRALAAARASGGRRGALEPLVRRLEVWREAGLRVVLAARARTQAERLAALLSHRDVEVSVGAEEEAPLRIEVGDLARGLVAPGEALVLVTEEEIFGHRAHRKPAKARSARAVLEDLRALEPGDFVVHAEHGVGRYLGLEHKTINGVTVDLLVCEYAAGDRLFLPVYRLNQIQKYSGGDGAPKIDRLGGQSFAKKKAKVERRVRQMADQLLKLYAERNALKKEPLGPPDDDFATFEATFPFEETRDQAGAISDVMRDLEKERVMDRLVCGDVGFGKTEVALRAAFRVAMAGKQVALLCPTTVLAQQHYLTFSTRLRGYPIQVRALSRFQSKKDQQETARGLKEGKVDVVIGTHRLLSKDVHFQDLGLLVVDEEQRFGVTHKERIKQLRATVDVLTLSATPIPRTLQLAIGGLRDMSIITTPPVDRRAIRTITTRWDEHLLREAIEREMGRGGQVFYVYNRVEDIYERANRVKELMPTARVAVAHGQMSETSLEKTMLDFVDGAFDILVCTAIIESGIDIPRANTMIVDRADIFGLSQLYQIRGRVGRSKERAYCYLVVPPPSRMSDEARARLEALERYTDLGSGFHIASLDMELRGAGELLGAEQSGFVASVGFEMFCQMLEEATQELQGETVVAEVDPELSFDVDALLPEDYVSEVGVRLSLYKRLASAIDDAAVTEVATEMEDRFGSPPAEARAFVELMRLKTELRRLRVLGCEATGKSVILHLREDTPLDPVKIGRLVGQRSLGYRLTPDMRLIRSVRENEEVADGLILADRMLTELADCLRPEQAETASGG